MCPTFGVQFKFQTTFYSGLTLNQDKATKPQTVQIVRQGEATPYWFKVNPLYLFPALHRYGSLNVRMRVVTFQLEIFKFECKQVFDFGIDFHHRQRAEVAAQL